MKESEEFCPANQKEWREWLQENHKTKDAVWLIFYKTKSPNFNLSWSESVDQALCFGWIDSTKRSIDDEKYKQYFCKRKAKSNWSKVNKDKIKALTAQGLMTQAGIESVEIAKANNSWTILDAVEALEVPTDLQEALDKEKDALVYFNSLSKSDTKMLLYWLFSAKRPATREKRISEIITSALQKTKPKPFW